MSRVARVWKLVVVVIALILPLTACKKTTPPTGFGVNLTINETALSSAEVALIASTHLSVTGAETYDLDLQKSRFSSGIARMHYTPQVSTGTLLFTVTALDTSGAQLAAGSSGNVSLVSGKAVAATVSLLAGGVGSDMSVTPPLDLAGVCGSGTPLTQGVACQADCQCGTGHCVDGFCCENGCDTSCMACNVAGLEGMCKAVPDGAAPASGHAACGPDAAKCQRDGMCDGAGACRLTPSGTTCKASQCVSNLFTAESHCDGAGTCVTPTAIGCDPYVCKDAATCWPSCSDVSQCAVGNACTNSSCGLKPDGATCADKTECSSGTCLDMVCCKTSTCPSCRNCGSTGNCDVVVSSKDDATAGICSVTSTCDSGGNCKKNAGEACTKVDGSECISGNCVDGFCCGAANCPKCNNCDSTGACNTVIKSAPDPTGAACSGTSTCGASGACGLVLGQTCSVGSTCASGNCVNSVCCDKTAAQCGGCQRCDNPGNLGVCSNVPDGTDPNNSCATTTTPGAIGGFTCKSGACLTTCSCPAGYPCDNQTQNTTSGIPDCKKCYYCNGTAGSATCRLKVAAGGSCGYNVQCGSSSSCNSGVCGATCTP